MRKVIVAAFQSLDGVIQAPGGPSEDPTKGFRFGGWIVPLMDESVGAEIGALFGEPYDLLLGRKTYEIFAAHWPFYPEGDADDGLIAKQFNQITKYVCTRSGDVDTSWRDSVVLRDAAKDVAKLKQSDGPNLVTQGSSDLIQTLFAADLVDEIRTFTFPVVLGNGKRLIQAGAQPNTFKLVKHNVGSSGSISATYERAGPVQSGDYGLVDPSPAEAKRQERMKREG
ncbi:MAG: dihydrofolate reductase family protein [Hyphomonadaceae bacterium]|nr:dihydrofolate reductase family protein [Hyphomonadaceae bacterium]